MPQRVICSRTRREPNRAWQVTASTGPGRDLSRPPSPPLPQPLPPPWPSPLPSPLFSFHLPSVSLPHLFPSALPPSPLASRRPCASPCLFSLSPGQGDARGQTTRFEAKKAERLAAPSAVRKSALSSRFLAERPWPRGGRALNQPL